MARFSSSRSPSPGTTVSHNSEDHHRQCQDEEMRYYNQLISDGGRPSHPISLDYDIARNSEEYREILSYWRRGGSKYSWMVFSRQWGEWRCFRDHQRYMRESDRFSAYCQRLHDRLTKHGFEQSFQLHKDPDQQNAMDTWIEFLNWEYWQYDESARVISRRQSRHDNAWKKLVDSKVLKSYETEELLWDFGYALQLRGEENQAREAANAAMSAVNVTDQALQKAQGKGLSRQSLAQMEQELFMARSTLATATKSLDIISMRRKLISEFKIQTKSYSMAQDDASSTKIVLRWILQQIPLIELELNPAKVAKNDPTQRNDKRQRSLKRNCTDDDNEEPVSKRRKQDDKHSMPSKTEPRVPIISEISSDQRPNQSELDSNSAKVVENDPTQRNVKRQRSLKRNRTDDGNDESMSKRRRQDDEHSMPSKTEPRVSIISGTSSDQRPKRLELELNSSKVVKNDPTQRNDKRQRNLKRNRTDDGNEESMSKRRKHDDEHTMPSKSKPQVSVISEETSSDQRPKRSSRSYIKPHTLALDPHPQRATRALRSSNTKSGSARSALVLNNSKQITSGRRRKDKGFDDSPKPRVLRRSTRLRRPPERFQ